MRLFGSRCLPALVLLLGATAWGDVFSPGELSKPHANLEGIQNCTQCHPQGGALSQETCLECHTELKGRVAKGNGFHGRIPEEQRNCETCHRDHQGRGFELIEWGKGGRAGFEHAKSGWLLHGKHQQVKCESCHDKRRVQVPIIVQLLEKQPTRQTYLGLRTACANCHFDEHRAQLKQECDTCHSETGWKAAEGFNHDETDYVLKGAHKKVACEKCHARVSDPKPMVFPPPVSETYAKFSDTAFAQCSDCHKDPHQGNFGAKCSSCHTVDGWKIIRNASVERGFHDKTRYPLKAEHLDVACEACHGPFPGKPAKFKNMAFEKCSDCHTDAHEGQLPASGAFGVTPTAMNAGKLRDCGECHSVEGFVPSRFTIASHERTRFKLEASHITVACDCCHLRNAALYDKIPAALLADNAAKHRQQLFSTFSFGFKKPTDQCQGCHPVPHGEQFSGRAGGCTSCHSVESWKKLSINHDTGTSFPLTGKHAKTACNKCHTPASADSIIIIYKPVEKRCEACHADPHARQFAAKTCDACHGTDDFTKTNFEHQPPFTTFLLEGKHTNLACEKCHAAVKTPLRSEPVRQFRGVPRECEGCHKDFHRGVFKGFEP